MGLSPRKAHSSHLALYLHKYQRCVGTQCALITTAMKPFVAVCVVSTNATHLRESSHVRAYQEGRSVEYGRHDDLLPTSAPPFMPPGDQPIDNRRQRRSRRVTFVRACFGISHSALSRTVVLCCPSLFAIPKLTDLGGQQLFFTDIRLTSRLFTTRHLFIGGNVDLKPLALHSLNKPPNGRRRSTRTAGEALGCNLHLASLGVGSPSSMSIAGSSPSRMTCQSRTTRRREHQPSSLAAPVCYPLKGNNAMRTGLRFFHFSDGNTAPRNPAFDGFMVYWSYTYRNFAPHLRRRR